MPSRMPAVLCALLLGCDSDTQFSNTDVDGTNEQGVGALSLDPEELVFTDLSWEEGVSQSMDITLTNVGDNNLSISVLDISDSGGGVFYTQDESNIVLQPGGSRDFTVVATLSTYEVAEGKLRVKTNDADYLDHRVPLIAYPVGWDGSTSGGEDSGADDTGE